MLVVYISRCSPAPAAAAYPMQRYGKLGETQNKWAHFFRLPRRRPATRPKPTPLCRAAARGPGRPADGPGGWAQAGRAMHACLRGWRRRLRFCVKQNDSTGPSAQQPECQHFAKRAALQRRTARFTVPNGPCGRAIRPVWRCTTARMPKRDAACKHLLPPPRLCRGCATQCRDGRQRHHPQRLKPCHPSPTGATIWRENHFFVSKQAFFDINLIYLHGKKHNPRI